ncbi:hypothetical protein H2203_003784 [Taxawa tesnikishii (nom. ined.)]|nr:hypothetical protein H2203_003784 [Dothideales sp. JES 119]
MRITPDPYEGLHPAIVHKPPPLSSSPWTICPAVGGCLGVLGWALGRAIKRPGLGTRTAAWSTSAYLILNLSSSEYVKRRRINPFLESKGIKVPKSKLVERTLDIDQDNFIILGMLVGIGTAGARRQPWAVFGWQRFVGALSFGAAGGAILSPLVDQQRYVAAFQRLEREREVAKLYEPEMKAFMMQNFFGKEDAQPADQPSSSMTPLQKLLKQAGPAGMQSPQGPPFDRLGAPQMPLFDANLDKDIDDEDPQPHLSEMRDGERIFKPNTNYTWSAGADAIPKLEEHIKLLRTRRSQLAKEAELLWHDLAAKEAVYYEIPIQAKEKADVRSMLQNMNHVHINLWLEIGMLDWMIADSNKNILQIKAMNKKSHWLPRNPNEEKSHRRSR